MNTKSVDAIANAVLYEGYMLYPYRPSSVKNRQRFNFGVLYPQSYSEAQIGSDAWSVQTECLVEGASFSAVEVRVRFLKLVDRSVRKLGTARAIRRTEPQVSNQFIALEVDGKAFAPWQEAIECEVTVPACNLDALTAAPLEWKFEFPAKAKRKRNSCATRTARLVGAIVRRQESVQGIVEITAARAADGIFKVQCG